jgi:O-antigen ligase
MWPIKTTLYFVLFWAACLMSLVNPLWGVVNYMFAYQTNPTNTWWGEPLESLGMRFSFLAMLFTVLGLFLGRRHVPSGGPSFTAWEWASVSLVITAFLSLLLGVTFDHRSRNAIDKLWKLMLFVLILTRVGGERKNLRLIVWTLVVGSLYVGHDAYQANPSDFLFGRLNRIGGPDFSTSSGTAAHMSAMLPIIGSAFLCTPSWLAKGLAAVAGAFTVNAIVLCRTRSAFLGLAAGALAAALMAPRARRFRIHCLMGMALALSFSLTDEHFWTRMKTLFDRQVLHTDMAAVSRTEIWATSVRILADHPLGIGVGNFARVITSYEPRYAKRSTHNTVVVCFVELGIIGGLLFLGLVGLSLYYVFACYRFADSTRNPLETRYLAHGLLVACVTYWVTGLGTERFYCESFWWVLALPVCLYRVVWAESRQEAPAMSWESDGAIPALGQESYAR